MGNRVVAGDAGLDLRTAAHEAAHVVQQRHGVVLQSGVGRVGDRYERHADAVADAVVRGQSAAPILDAFVGRATSTGPAQSPGLQRKEDPLACEGQVEPMIPRDDGCQDPLWINARRDEVETALNGLDLKMQPFIKACSLWQTTGWNAFIGECAGNPVLGLSAEEYRDMCRGIVAVPEDVGGLGAPAPRGDEKSTGEEVVDRTAGAAVFVGLASSASKVTSVGRAASILRTALGGTGLPGLVLNVVVSAVWEIVSELFFGGDEDAKPLDVSRATAGAIDSIGKKLAAAGERAHGDWRMKRAAVSGIISRASSFAELDELEQLIGEMGASMREPPTNASSLFNALRARWVAQHSATPTEANSDTDDDAWEKSKPSPNTMAGAKDLFIDQCSYLWAVHGLGVTTPKQTLRAAFARLETRPAAEIASTLTGHPIALPLPIHLAMFEAKLPKGGPGVLGPSYPVRKEDIRGATRAAGYSLACEPTLAVSDGAVVVESMLLTLTPDPRSDADVEGSRIDELPAIHHREWRVRPGG